MPGEDCQSRGPAGFPVSWRDAHSAVGSLHLRQSVPGSLRRLTSAAARLEGENRPTGGVRPGLAPRTIGKPAARGASFFQNPHKHIHVAILMTLAPRMLWRLNRRRKYKFENWMETRILPNRERGRESGESVLSKQGFGLIAEDRRLESFGRHLVPGQGVNHPLVLQDAHGGQIDQVHVILGRTIVNLDG